MLETSSEKPINLFWSGGWDSTFRLLQLVLDENRVVQPYYIICKARVSLKNELQAMEEIRALINNEFPLKGCLILPTKMTDLENIVEDIEITDAYNKVNEKKPLGYQYAWLAWFCKQNGIDDMELSFERNTVATIYYPFQDHLIQKDQSGIFVIDPVNAEPAEYTLFKHFLFPIYAYTKLDIRRLVRQKGWWKFQKKTWFCFTPIHGKIPCGTCRPCRLSISENRGFGIPLYIRVLNALSLTGLIRRIMHHILLYIRNENN